MLVDAFSRKGMAKEAAQALGKTVVLASRHARAQYLPALSLAAQGLLDEAQQHYHTAISLQPGIDISPELHFLLRGQERRNSRVPAVGEPRSVPA